LPVAYLQATAVRRILLSDLGEALVEGSEVWLTRAGTKDSKPDRGSGSGDEDGEWTSSAIIRTLSLLHDGNHNLWSREVPVLVAESSKD
jgi:hypothetical protein